MAVSKEFDKRLPPWRRILFSLLLVSSFLLFSCAAHKKPDTETTCRAKGVASWESMNERSRSEFQLLFEPVHDRLSIYFMSPLGSRAGRILISGEHGEWIDGRGTSSLKDHRIFKKWFTDRWKSEMELILGVSTTDASDRVRCEASQKNPVRSCLIEEPGLRVNLEFSLIDC